MGKTIHGLAGTPTWNAWSKAKQRCLNAKNPNYGSYGGRGIRVCEAWMAFDGFLADMGVKPPGTSLERKDVNGDYEPNNCRWATRLEQANNTRRNHIIVAFGRSLSINQWARETGIHPSTIGNRINVLGHTPEEAVGRPVRKMS